MEQNDGSQSAQKNTDNQYKIWNVSYTAIAIWCWLIVVLLVRLWVFDRVPDIYKAQVFIESIFTLAIVDVIVVHAVMYYKQAKEANKQAESNARILEFNILAEQATVRVAKWEKPFGADSKLFISNLFHNGGRTPAWNVQPLCPYVAVGTDLENAQPLVPIDVRFDPYNLGMIVAGAGLPFTVIFRANDDLIKEIEDGKACIFVDGSCSYYDSFGGQKLYTYKVTLRLNPHGVDIRHDWQHRIYA